MQNTLINICGSERSGSTMLDLILGNDPKAFSCGEVYALYHPWRKHHFHPKCGCGEECEYLRAFKKTREDQFHQMLFEKFGYSWVVDSSKDLCWVIDNQKWLIRIQGRVLNLAIWKQPWTFSLSYLKRGRGSNTWRPIFIDYYKKFLDAELPFVSICYDDFVQAPEIYLAEICGLLDMNNFAGKLNFWEKAHHQLFGSGGTSRQVQNGSSEIFRQEMHPPDLVEQAKLVQAGIEHDHEVQGIICQLRQKELFATSVNKAERFNQSELGRKPLWYYKQKMALAVRRYFPETLA
jgi:hypothetical protein